MMFPCSSLFSRLNNRIDVAKFFENFSRGEEQHCYDTITANIFFPGVPGLRRFCSNFIVMETEIGGNLTFERPQFDRQQASLRNLLSLLRNLGAQLKLCM